MSFYPEKINRCFLEPRNAGLLDEANAVGAQASFVCGAFLRISLQIDAETKRIRRAKFKTDGCGFMIAAVDVLAEKVAGNLLTELHGPEILKTEIENELELFPAERKHCLETVLNAFKTALADFRARQIEEFTGEKALICTCFGVSEERIETLIKTQSANSVEEIGILSNAGTGCGSCRFLIRELLDAETEAYSG